ncbi:FAD-dependent oxidoreductase [Paenibacillus aquistagni]|uniref:2-polyprenyl-6-methoxyphenol hydroxylase n=1 Tax=Paenibacillus aquistagni TaxID=1852522 RepID=A0A1X7KLN3_9BACL|nr:FAD-dependent oxidoreductase [Paenibacillus aquistagni]SMG42422.1 2-polyprenyl-6-methoxyphenol hydroxylase [Paenibacillus aquistagni]
MTKVIVLGGGIAGLSTAIALQREGFDVHVYEKTKRLKPVGAGIMIAANATRIFNEWGLTERLRAKGNHLEKLLILSEKGKMLSSISPNPVPEQTIAIHRADLHQVLMDELGTTNVSLGKGANHVLQGPKHVRVSFDDGTEAEGDYVVAADGIHSAVRRQILPQVKNRYAGYTCWRGVAPSARLQLRSELHEIWGPEGRFGYLPISSDQVYWYILMNTKPDNQALGALRIADLAKRFERYTPMVQNILQLADEESCLHHDIYDIPLLDRYSFGRIALVGDAAHAMTPNLGQGACQGIEDAYVLGKCLGSNLESGLQDYENMRLPRANKISKIARQVGIMSQLDSRLWCAVRNGVMRIAPPRLLRGQARYIYEYAY